MTSWARLRSLVGSGSAQIRSSRRRALLPLPISSSLRLCAGIPLHSSSSPSMLATTPFPSQILSKSYCSSTITTHSQKSKEAMSNQPHQLSLNIHVTTKGKGKAVRVCYGCGADIVPKSKAKEDNINQDSNFQVIAKGGGGGEETTATKSRASLYYKAQRELIRKSKIRNWSLCPRCIKLKQQQETGDLAVAPTTDGAAMEAFRQEVQSIREHHAVVVLVVDAMNPAATILNKLRHYVGGNPILLAVTRCDLLPNYYQLNQDQLSHRMKQDFAKLAKELNVAEVFMVSLPPGGPKPKSEAQYYDYDDDDDDYEYNEHNHNHKNASTGVPQLAAALLKKRSHRDVYIVGAANIGKSTLTDALVDELLQQQKLQDFLVGSDDGSNKRIALKRIDAVQSMRVTQSALPGTTLQNIRVPCFANHKEALWDTPGLLLDQSRHHFPIRNLQQLQRSTPSQIVPSPLDASNQKRVVVELYDPNEKEQLPYLRVVVRLRKRPGDDAASQDTSTRLVWNSIFGLQPKIVQDNNNNNPSTRTRAGAKKNHALDKDNHQEENDNEKKTPRNPAERQARKEEKRRAYHARVKAEQEALGMAEWKRQQRQEEEETAEEQRRVMLQDLKLVKRVEIASQQGTDIAIENLGWFGFLCDRDALVEVYAPSTGVQVSSMPAVALPRGWNWHWNNNNNNNNNIRGRSDDSLKNDDTWNDSDDEDWFEGDEYHDDWDGEDEFMHEEDSADWSNDPGAEEGIENLKGRAFPNDPWADFSGPNVGYEFIADIRFSQGKLWEGWHPIKKEEPNPDSPGPAVANMPEWKAPMIEDYRVEYPEPWRRSRCSDNYRGGRDSESYRGRGQSGGKGAKGKRFKNSNKGMSKKQKKSRGKSNAVW